MDDSTALDDLFAPAAAEERRSTRVVDVLVPVALDRCYSYRAPESLDLKPGDLVAVPLGTRETLGIVWDADPDAPMGSGANLKAVSAKHDWPPVSPTLRRFVDWIASYTLAPRGMVARMAIRDPDRAEPERPRYGIRRTGNA